MEIQLTFIDEVDDKESESLWKQGVNLDDWDYMLLAPVDILKKEKDEDGNTCYRTENFDIDDLLHGCCSNTWYKAKYKGKEYAIGVAYHA